MTIVPEAEKVKVLRKIIEIDEDLCTGCGNCVLDCQEGAIQIINGKAKVISDNLCDGMGNCIGRCPTDALKIIERETDPYELEAVHEHLARQGKTHGQGHGHDETNEHHGHGRHGAGHASEHASEGCGCGSHGAGHSAGGQVGGCASLSPIAPQKSAGGAGESGHGGIGMMPKGAGQSIGYGAAHTIGGGAQHARSGGCGCPSSAPIKAQAGAKNWPVKLRLASSIELGADVLLTADCAAQVADGFTVKYANGKTLLTVCPKFEDREALTAKLAELFRQSKPKSVTSIRMEVPCCSGIGPMGREAVQRSGVDTVLREIILTRGGEELH